MTDKQPDALILANDLEGYPEECETEHQAAAELRRLHLEIERLKAERDELLAALKNTVATIKENSERIGYAKGSPIDRQVRAASDLVAKAEGQS